jgi:hypothetical protein
MIDYRTYLQMHPTSPAFNFSTHQKVPFDRWPETISHHTELKDDNLLILPPEIHGFAFKKKKWRK